MNAYRIDQGRLFPTENFREAAWIDLLEPTREVETELESYLEIAGLPVPDNMQGASLLPFLRGETPDDWRTSFYYHY